MSNILRLIMMFFLISPMRFALGNEVHIPLHSLSNIVGWHWYNQPEVQKPKAIKKSNAFRYFQSLSASDQLKILQQATFELRAKAVLSGKVQDIANYKRAQDMWVDKATQFTLGWERMLLAHPELNYALKYSDANRLAPVMQQQQHKKERMAIKQIAQQDGLIFFYRGSDQGDRLYAKFVNELSHHYHFALLAVSVDGQSSHVFGSGEQMDRNHQKARSLGVSYFPALVLVNPKTGSHQIMSYGFKSKSELASRFLSIADNWKPNY